MEDYIRLNKFLAQSGLAKSRRQADELIKQGSIKINGQLTTELGTKVHPSKDSITVNGKTASLQKKNYYVLLNKPKNCISTRKDEKDRRTIYHFVEHKEKDLLKPVGRLDRNTTGLLMLTNDGDMIQSLTHPSFGIKKIYEVRFDKRVNEDDFLEFQKGKSLEDGFFKPDKVALLEDYKSLGIEIHSGKNRIVRRFFEAFGYEVIALDRVYFAGLTKYKLPRGKSRELQPKEVRFIQSQLSKKMK